MRFLLHIIAVLHVPLVLAVGYATNTLLAAAYAGSAVGAAGDPALIVFGIAAGVIASRTWQLALGVIALSTALHFFIVATNELATGSFWSFAGRLGAMTTIAFAVNLGRQVMVRASQRTNQPSNA